MPNRQGIVYIAPGSPSHHAFEGYWDQSEPPDMLEEGPGWNDPEDAVAWGRERADRVMIRLGDDDTSIYSAGTVRLTTRADGSGDPYPEWPSLRRRP